MRRRRFLGSLAALGLAGVGGAKRAGGAIPSPVGHGKGPAGRPLLPPRWGVQLYTLRDRMAEDVPGTLRAVAEMGYGEVEFAGLFGWSADDMRRLLDDLGLRAVSSHHGMGVIRNGWQAALEDAAALGQEMVVIPSLPPDARTAEGLRALAAELNVAGEEAGRYGLLLGFHNHDFEVTPLPVERPGATPERPLDILLARTDPERVTFQMDLFWTVHGGADPELYFLTHRDRFTSVHAKDRTASGQMVAVGEGTLDFATLLTVGEDQGGVRHVFVEHDRPEDPMESVRTSIAHLESLRG